jgi:hypothetical protein
MRPIWVGCGRRSKRRGRALLMGSAPRPASGPLALRAGAPQSLAWPKSAFLSGAYENQRHPRLSHIEVIFFDNYSKAYEAPNSVAKAG